MVRIRQTTKIVIALSAPIILHLALFSAFGLSGVRIFYGDRSDALNTLNGVVQSLSAIVAIVFSIVIVVVQTTLGKYVAKAAWYVITDWVNMLMLFLYVSTIAIALATMWIIASVFWDVWMDVAMTSSLVCLCALIPFFLRMPQSLKPSSIMSQVKDEILDACNAKDLKTANTKTNLLFTMTRKSIEGGDIEFAFEGFALVEEVIRLENARENEWLFLELVQSLLHSLAIENSARNPNVTMRILDVYVTLFTKIKGTPFVFVNMTNRIAHSMFVICNEARHTKFISILLLRTSSLLIDFYRVFLLTDSSMAGLLEPHLRATLKMCRESQVFEMFRLGFQIEHSIMDLLRKEKRKEALRMLLLILEELPESTDIKMSVMGLVIDSKAEGFNDFASSSLEIVTKKFAPFRIDTFYDPELGEGRRQTSVSPEGSFEIKTGDKKMEEASLWANQEMSRIGKPKPRRRRRKKEGEEKASIE